jgi:CBS-domain-containing membrane protein
MTDIKGKDPILQKTQPNESPAQKKNVARGVVWAMIGLGVATLLYFVFVFVIAGARA